jgi:dihydroflavonol-4-reductase
MQVFLTGGTGFIGQALVRVLRRRGCQLQVLVRNPGSAAAQWLQHSGATLVRGDVTEPGRWQRALAGADVLVHNAGLHVLGADAALARRMQHVNVQGTRQVLTTAAQARLPRSVFVSSAWALGATGPGPADEDHQPPGPGPTACERSQRAAHQVALALRAQGLPLCIALPNTVVGVNDHGLFGYLLRLHLLHRLPPLAFGADSVHSLVDVDALAEGLALCATQAAMGQDYLFCGEALTVRQWFALLAQHPGGAHPALWLPLALARPQLALLAPLLRAAGLPAFLSPDTVASAMGHRHYSAAKAQRELGWWHPAPGPMWAQIVAGESERMSGRRSFLDKLRHQELLQQAPGATA